MKLVTAKKAQPEKPKSEQLVALYLQRPLKHPPSFFWRHVLKPGVHHFTKALAPRECVAITNDVRILFCYRRCPHHGVPLVRTLLFTFRAATGRRSSGISIRSSPRRYRPVIDRFDPRIVSMSP